MTQPFFVAGGALRADAPSYVERRADDKLYNLALDGHFAYVLTSRQMGKSSLMNRTARRLKATGVQAVRIDLTGIGVVTIDEWYFGLLTELQRQLRLDIDLYEWWTEREKLGHIQRFIAFLREVVLGQTEAQVIIFIDEIDTTLKLEFADDFFAGIRSIYNGRDAEPAWDRLSFILLGVATPSDLVQDNSRTPFNIGQGVELLDFSREEGQLLQAGLTKLSGDQRESVFARVYHWADGHPYMTQHLCEQVVQNLDDDSDVDGVEEQVDALVCRLFLSEEAQNEKNLSYIRDRIVEHPQRRQLLQLYRSVLRGKAVKEDRQSIVQNELKLAALVKTKQGDLQVRNRIYAENFDLAWVKELMQINWTAVAAWSLGVIAFLAVMLIGYDYWVDNTVNASYVALSPSKLNDLTVPERRTHLATIFYMQTVIGQNDYDDMAVERFYNWSSIDQVNIFKFQPYHPKHSWEILAIVEGLSNTLAYTEDVPDNTLLLRQMNRALIDIQQLPEPHLDRWVRNPLPLMTRQAEIESWVTGREHTTPNEIHLALDAYATAITINTENPATLYERAKLWSLNGSYNEGLKDLDTLVGILGSIPTATPMPTPTINAANVVASNNESAISNIPASTLTFIPFAESNSPELTNSVIHSTTPAAYKSNFINSSQRINVVQNLLDSEQNLSDSLANDANAYPNLQEFNLIPSITPIPQDTPTIIVLQPTPTDTGASEIIRPRDILWPNGKTIKISFMDGEDEIHQEVKKYAQVWAELINLSFDFGEYEDADVRISFELGRGDWSYIGTDALFIEKNEPVMNLGRLAESYARGDADDVGYVILHNFGHLIGLNHEQLNPTNTIPWDHEALYDYHSQKEFWTRDQVNRTYLTPWHPETYPVEKSFDPESIMLYPIENALTIGDFEVGFNYRLSEGDIAFAQLLYPKSTILR